MNQQSWQNKDCVKDLSGSPAHLLLDIHGSWGTFGAKNYSTEVWIIRLQSVPSLAAANSPKIFTSNKDHFEAFLDQEMREIILCNKAFF